MGPRKKESKKTALRRRSQLEERTHMLGESEFILIGTITLLGFAFQTLFTDVFSRLSTFFKYLHFAALYFFLLTILLLLAPTLYHRIGEKGFYSARVSHISHNLIIYALITLMIGISIEVVVTCFLLTKSDGLSIAVGFLTVVLFYFVWFHPTKWIREELE